MKVQVNGWVELANMALSEWSHLSQRMDNVTAEVSVVSGRENGGKDQDIGNKHNALPSSSGGDNSMEEQEYRQWSVDRDCDFLSLGL